MRGETSSGLRGEWQGKARTVRIVPAASRRWSSSTLAFILLSINNNTVRFTPTWFMRAFQAKDSKVKCIRLSAGIRFACSFHIITLRETNGAATAFIGN